MLAPSAVDRGFELWSVQTKDYKIGFAAFPLSTHQYGIRQKTGCLGIRIMCQSEATCLLVDCCFSELALLKSNYNVRVLV
jgi:hypothetical protein